MTFSGFYDGFMASNETTAPVQSFLANEWQKRGTANALFINLSNHFFKLELMFNVMLSFLFVFNFFSFEFTKKLNHFFLVQNLIFENKTNLKRLLKQCGSEIRSITISSNFGIFN